MSKEVWLAGYERSEECSRMVDRKRMPDKGRMPDGGRAGCLLALAFCFFFWTAVLLVTAWYWGWV